MKPDGHAVVQPDGAFVGIWRDRAAAELICNRSPSAKGERIEPMVFVATVSEPTEEQLWAMVRAWHGVETDQELLDFRGYDLEIDIAKMRLACAALSPRP